MHHIQFQQILRDAEVARVVSPIIRKYGLDVDEAASALEKCRVERPHNVAVIASRL